MANNNVTHKGIIIQSEANRYKIQLMDEINCQSCSIKSSCGLQNNEAKTIDVISNINFEKGNEVLVIMKEKYGLIAVLLAYVFPFLLLIVSLSVFLFLSFSEPKAALLSLLLTALYYLLLYVNNNRIKSIFQFEIKKR